MALCTKSFLWTPVQVRSPSGQYQRVVSVPVSYISEGKGSLYTIFSMDTCPSMCPLWAISVPFTVQNLFYGHPQRAVNQSVAIFTIFDTILKTTWKLSKYVAPLGNISTFYCTKSFLWTPAMRSEPISGYFYNFWHNFANNLEVVQVRSPSGQYQ